MESSAFWTIATTVVVVGMAVVAVVVVGAVLRALWEIVRTPVSQHPDRAMSAEEEGNVHSGPHGYTGGAYPETQYGSGFDPDADWNHRGDE